MSQLPNKAYELVLKMLARRSHSKAEVRRRLERRGIAAGEIETALGRLEELGYLSDRAYARERAHALVESRRMGPASVVRRLSAEGIDESDAEAAVAEASANKSERDLAAAALAGRRPPVDAHSPREDRLRAARWLVGRGFSEEAARALLNLHDERTPE